MSTITCHHDREAWIAARLTGIGASEAPAVMGLSKWSSPFSVWCQKTGKVPYDDEPSEYMRWGSILEAPVREEFVRRTNLSVEHLGPYAIVWHETIPWLFCSPDGLIGDDGLYEGKTANAFATHDWDESVPDYVLCQVQHQLAVTGRFYCYVCVLIGGSKLKYYCVNRDDLFIGEMLKVLDRFWTLVESDVPPDVDGNSATSNAIRRLHPNDSGRTVILPEVADLILEEREILKSHAAKLKTQIDELDNRLKLMLKDATWGQTQAGFTVSYKTTERAGYTVEPATFRQLRVSKPKGKRSTEAV